MALRPYDAVLCDVDGVLRHWPAYEERERAHGFPVGALAAAAFAPSRLLPAITGEVTDEQWRAGVAEDLAAVGGSPERARALVAAWADALPEVDHEVMSLLGRARAVAVVGLVSNATTRLERDLDRQGLRELADFVVNTSRIGVIKPDPRVYRIAAEQAGAPVHRCLFIDDTAANVAAAREVGMPAVHFRRAGDLREALGPLLDNSLPLPGRP